MDIRAASVSERFLSTIKPSLKLSEQDLKDLIDQFSIRLPLPLKYSFLTAAEKLEEESQKTNRLLSLEDLISLYMQQAYYYDMPDKEINTQITASFRSIGQTNPFSTEQLKQLFQEALIKERKDQLQRIGEKLQGSLVSEKSKKDFKMDLDFYIESIIDKKPLPSLEINILDLIPFYIARFRKDPTYHHLNLLSDLPFELQKHLQNAFNTLQDSRVRISEQTLDNILETHFPGYISKFGKHKTILASLFPSNSKERTEFLEELDSSEIFLMFKRGTKETILNKLLEIYIDIQNGSSSSKSQKNVLKNNLKKELFNL